MAGIPDSVVDAIARGEAVLFLGSGASFNCINGEGDKSLTGEGLRDLISSNLLGGKFEKKSLSYVADLARNEHCSRKLFELLELSFSGFSPLPHHLEIAKFKWRSIFTTNYDCAIESGYDTEAKSRLQTPRVVVKDENIDRLKSGEVPIVKLHGCIASGYDERYQPILSSQEYAACNKTRGGLFRFFAEQARLSHVIFVGYALEDHNIAQILFDLGDSDVKRPLYVNVNPALQDEEERHWASKRITPVRMTAEDFFAHLNSIIEPNKRLIGSLMKNENPLSKFSSSGSSPSSDLLAFIQKSITLVNADNLDTSKAEDFYRGFSGSYDAIERGYDVKRRLSEDVKVDIGIDSYEGVGLHVCLLKGYAGSGKSIASRRVLWDLSNELDRLCVEFKAGMLFETDSIIELIDVVDDRLILYIENPLDMSTELIRFFKDISTTGRSLTVLLNARTNEWNTYGDSLSPHIDSEFELRNLSESEISTLVEKLITHKVVPKQDDAEKSSLKERFKLTYDRQLLVALHEVTYGKPFDQICIDEYQSIAPEEARALYLDVCTLHRLGVSPRCGLISRISGIDLVDFREKFIAPLEHLVKVEKGRFDYSYVTRHRVIADVVYERAVITEDSRLAQLERIIRHIDPSYSSDALAAREIINGGKLAELFPTRVKGLAIFDAAADSCIELSFLFHQRALFELRHNNGVLREALRSIEECERLHGASVPSSVKHTKANILRRTANRQADPHAKNSCRSAAKSLLRAGSQNSSHNSCLLIDILIDELSDSFSLLRSSQDSISDSGLPSRIEEIERLFRTTRTTFQNDEHVDQTEARFATELSNSPRALEVLNTAFKRNPTNGFLAIRLARLMSDTGEISESKDVLRLCLEKNPLNADINYEYARSLIKEDEEANSSEVLRCLKRSFSDGDSRYRPQLWCARQNFIYGDRTRALQLFAGLKKIPLPPQVRNQGIGVHKFASGSAVLYEGTCEKKLDEYGFMSCVKLSYSLFFHVDRSPDLNWEALSRGDKLIFELDFSVAGIFAKNVQFST